MKNKYNYFWIIGLFYLLLSACQFSPNEKKIEFFQYLTNGKSLYEKHCENCHGLKGEGFQKLYPPLTDTCFLKKNKENLACMIKYGIQNDSIQINKQWYFESMPSNNQLKSIDIAQIIVYITNNFGNNQGGYEYQKVEKDLSGCKLKN